MRYGLLGPIQALGDDGAALPVGQPKQRVVLAVLLLARGRFVSRDELLAAVWREQPPRSAIGSLHVYIHGLRKALGEQRIESCGEAYRAAIDPDELPDQLDLARFEWLVARARDALAAGYAIRAVALTEQALALWRGSALADLPADALLPERAMLSEQHLSAGELLAEARLAQGAAATALELVTAVIQLHPYRERLRELQILALYRLGRQQDALDAYRVARETLVEELGLEPGPRLRELQAAVLAQSLELPVPASPRPSDPLAPLAAEQGLPEWIAESEALQLLPRLDALAAVARGAGLPELGDAALAVIAELRRAQRTLTRRAVAV